MTDIKYIGLDKLKDYEAIALKEVIDHYVPFFERKVTKSLLTVGVRKSSILGHVGRFEMKLALESPQGKFHVEQSGWGIIKTSHRCGNHMRDLLEHHIRKELLGHKPRKARRR